MNQPQIIKPEEHGLDPHTVDHDAFKIIARLQRHGYEAYVVGGGVRDLLLKKQPKDFDVATNATPTEIKKVFNNCRIIGKRFKLAHIYFRGRKVIELSTFRSIVNDENDENVFGTIETDAFRRDLTINGLFYDPLSGVIIDYVNGYQDLKNRVIKIIGKPEERFQEDPVRIIRCLRHQARTGFIIDKKTDSAIKKSTELLSECPGPRIFDEFRKDCLSGYLQEVIGHFIKYKIVHHFLPTLSEKLINDSRCLTELNSCIKGIDRLSLERKLDDITIPFTIFALFTIPNFEICEHFHSYFKTRQEMINHIREHFPNPLLPKRQKKDAVDLLRLYWLLDKAANSKRKFRNPPESYKQDFKKILKLININQSKMNLNKVYRFI